MANGAFIRWSQVSAVVAVLAALAGAAVAVANNTSNIAKNTGDIEKQDEEDRRIKTRVRATEQNQAVVNSRTQRIEMDLKEVDRKIELILQRLPSQ